MYPSPEDYFRSAPQLIGRTDELDVVLAAILKPDPQAQIMLIEGQGGIGKTRLLVEINQRCAELPAVCCTQLIDLYLTKNQQPLRILYAIALQLQEVLALRGVHEPLFGEYIREMNRFTLAQGEGTDDQRQQVELVFLREFAALAANQRIVLLFDTLEKIHPAIPEAERFDFRVVGRLEVWLVNLLGRLPNTVVLLAGRPRIRQRELFVRHLGSRFYTIMMAPFTLSETADYIASAFPDLPPFEQDQIATLHTISGGRPVVLAIALACAQHETIDITALPAEFAQPYPENRDRLSEAFVRLLMEDLQASNPALAQMLARAVYLRKGLRVSLLQRVMADEGQPQTSDELAQQLAALARFVFAKPIESGELLLHDEMYELLLGKIAYQQAPQWWRSTVAYLDEQIQATKASLLHPAPDDPGPLRYGPLQLKLQTLQIERMFYQMSLNLRRGYQNYRELSSNALAGRNDDFDTQLQEELARFLDGETAWGKLYLQRLRTSGITWERIIYDEGIRWVYRRINAHIPDTDRYQEAIALAERVRTIYPEIYNNELLAQCDLDAAELQASVYIPDKAPKGSLITASYAQLTRDLQQVLATLPPEEADGAYARFILANACNYWGYFERMQERLQSATSKYKEALRLYIQLGSEVDSLQAVTLNNLGYALGRQGKSQQGLPFLARSLELVERSGAVYRIAATINTQAHLWADLGKIAQALECVMQAHQLLAQFDSLRATALNANAEGRVRSRIAYLQADPNERAAEYERAVAAYQKAITSFDQEGEIIRQIEIRGSLARTLRDWASLSLPAEAESRRREALNLLAAAEAITTPKTPRVVRCSLLETRATLLIDSAQYASARRVLDEARQLLPPGLQRDDQPVGSTETDELRLYWLRFAQLELQYALCAFGEQEPVQGCIYLLRAFVGLDAFSTSASPLERFVQLARQALFGLADPAAVLALRQATEAAAAQEALGGRALELVLGLIDQVAEELEDRDLLQR